MNKELITRMMKIKKIKTKRRRVDIWDDEYKIQELKWRIDAKHQATKMLIFENDFRFFPFDPNWTERRRKKNRERWKREGKTTKYLHKIMK